MKGHEATSEKEWMEADRTPPFVAVPNEGKLPVMDIVLQAVTTIALELPQAKHALGFEVELYFETSDDASRAAILEVMNALLQKHLRVINSKGDRNSPPVAARGVIIDILANKTDWRPYAGIFAAFAERNDQDFFEQLVRGKQRKRKQAFSPPEWFCLMNWHYWGDAAGIFKNADPVPPALKFWTDEAVLEYIENTALMCHQPFKMNLSGFRSMRTRLGLKQVKPALVTRCRPTPGKEFGLQIEGIGWGG